MRTSMDKNRSDSKYPVCTEREEEKDTNVVCVWDNKITELAIRSFMFFIHKIICNLLNKIVL